MTSYCDKCGNTIEVRRQEDINTLLHNKDVAILCPECAKGYSPLGYELHWGITA